MQGRTSPPPPLSLPSIPCTGRSRGGRPPALRNPIPPCRVSTGRLNRFVAEIQAAAAGGSPVQRIKYMTQVGEGGGGEGGSPVQRIKYMTQVGVRGGIWLFVFSPPRPLPPSAI